MSLNVQKASPTLHTSRAIKVKMADPVTDSRKKFLIKEVIYTKKLKAIRQLVILLHAKERSIALWELLA